jgi:hypothetical protein
LTSIYGPCHAEEKDQFIDWFGNIDMPEDTDWIIMGDFNFIRNPMTEINMEEMLMKC